MREAERKVICVQGQMRELLKEYVQKICKIYGKSLAAVILYGSYARGDFRPDSDVDIMILVNLTEEEIQNSRERISDVTYDFNMEHDVEVMPIVKAVEHFRYWLPVYPFYQNVNQEGVSLYVA